MESTSFVCELSLQSEKSEIAVAYNFKISTSIASASVIIASGFFSLFSCLSNSFAVLFLIAAMTNVMREKAGPLPETYSRVQYMFRFFLQESIVFSLSQGLPATLFPESMTPWQHNWDPETQQNCNPLRWHRNSNQEQRGWKTNAYSHHFKTVTSLLAKKPIFYFLFGGVFIALFQVTFTMWASLMWSAFCIWELFLLCLHSLLLFDYVPSIFWNARDTEGLLLITWLLPYSAEHSGRAVVTNSTEPTWNPGISVQLCRCKWFRYFNGLVCMEWTLLHGQSQHKMDATSAITLGLTLPEAPCQPSLLLLSWGNRECSGTRPSHGAHTTTTPQLNWVGREVDAHGLLQLL